jgi:hypothetical protein
MTAFLPACDVSGIVRVDCPCEKCAEMRAAIIEQMYDEERDKHFDARRREDRRDVLRLNGRCY